MSCLSIHNTKPTQTNVPSISSFLLSTKWMRVWVVRHFLFVLKCHGSRNHARKICFLEPRATKFITVTLYEKAITHQKVWLVKLRKRFSWTCCFFLACHLNPGLILNCNSNLFVLLQIYNGFYSNSSFVEACIAETPHRWIKRVILICEDLDLSSTNIGIFSNIEKSLHFLGVITSYIFWSLRITFKERNQNKQTSSKLVQSWMFRHIKDTYKWIKSMMCH